MTDRLRRLRAVVHAQFALLVVFCVLLAAVGGWLVWTTHASPETVQEDRVVTAWESSGTYGHTATVTQENSVFPVGTELEDRETYFARIAPVFTATYTHRHTAPTDMNVELDADLLLRSIEGDTVHWSERRDLDAERADGVPADEPVSLTVSVNASAVDARLEEIKEDLGSTPGETEAVMRTTVTVSGTVDGEAVELERHQDLLLALSGDTYGLDPRGEATRRVERTEPATVDREYGPLRSLGGPLLLLLGLVGTGGLAAGRVRKAFALDDAERRYMEYRDDREEFAEWITRISPPAEVHDLPRAEAASLADLVDFAIDADAGVIEDPASGDYLVTHDGTLYAFTPPDDPTTRGASSGDRRAASALEDERGAPRKGVEPGEDGTDPGDDGSEPAEPAASTSRTSGTEPDGSSRTDGDEP